jgi:HEAT repeat protein
MLQGKENRRMIRGFQCSVAYMTIRVLGNIGPDAKAAVPALLEICADSDKWLRQAAADALWRIDPQTAASDRVGNVETSDKDE